LHCYVYFSKFKAPEIPLKLHNLNALFANQSIFFLTLILIAKTIYLSESKIPAFALSN